MGGQTASTHSWSTKGGSYQIHPTHYPAFQLSPCQSLQLQCIGTKDETLSSLRFATRAKSAWAWDSRKTWVMSGHQYFHVPHMSPGLIICDLPWLCMILAFHVCCRTCTPNCFGSAKVRNVAKVRPRKLLCLSVYGGFAKVCIVLRYLKSCFCPFCWHWLARFPCPLLLPDCRWITRIRQNSYCS